MSHLVHPHWLSLFGALSLGIVVGWLTYLVATTRWTDRPVHIAIGAVAIGVLLVIAKVLPARYGTRLELGVVLAVVVAIGCLVGWALRDLADFVPPATRPGATASAAAAGSYLYRDALAGMGASPAYMRATTGHGGPARVQLPPHADDLAQAPGGYTFPKALPFSDATTSRARPEAATATGLRRHWTHPAPATNSPAAAIDSTPAGGTAS